MEKEFVPYELAVKLKALGFDEPCFFAFDNCSTPMRCSDLRTNKQKFNGVNYNSSTYTSQPTLSQAFRFFREKYGYSHSITQHEIIEGQTDLLYIDESEEFQDIEWLARVETDFIKIFKTYEEAELACLDKLIEIVKSKLE